MDRTTRKIGIILLFIILVPALFYSAYEITNLNENEQVIESIYSSQLDAILFSINQYSEDIITSWSSNLNSSMPDTSTALFFSESPSVASFFTADTSREKISLTTPPGGPPVSTNELKILLEKISPQIKKLIGFTAKGYIKLQPVENPLNDNGLVIFIRTQDETPGIGGIFFNQEEFIGKILAPRIQAVGGERFIIFVSRNSDNYRVFSNSQAANTQKTELLKPLWLMPGYSLGIALKGETIESLASERLYTNLVLIVLLNLILLFGIWLIFRNIKKEIQLAQIKSDFVANVSHELRTPLALVNIFAETLEMGRVRTEEKKQEYYTIITQEIGRLSKIVNKILNFSKMEAGKRSYSFTGSDLNNIVTGVFNTYKFHLQNHGFSYELDLDENPLTVMADREAVSEAVINLIDNAIKYSQDNKFIRIGTGRKNGAVFVEVQDKGIGISPEHQKKIFDKFFRVQSGLIHNKKGTGLGLTIIRHIMDAHNGDIELESSPWHGSTFRLNFPSPEANNKD